MATYEAQRERAEDLFRKTRLVHCPFYDENVVLTADGLHDLRYSGRSERPKNEQILKFTLLPLALEAIRRSGTVQEYRRSNYADPRTRAIKTVQYWAFIAILGQARIRVRAVVRRRGDGNLTFWSVMPAMKLMRGEDPYDQMMRLASDDIDTA